jgi:hypothetical protein
MLIVGTFMPLEFQEVWYNWWFAVKLFWSAVLLCGNKAYLKFYLSASYNAYNFIVWFLETWALLLLHSQQ